MMGACATVPMVTTSTDCSNAQSSVVQMNSVFQSLGSPSQYQDQITSINNAIQAAVSWYSTFGMCATAFNIGIEADTLTNQMLSDAGKSGVQGPTCGDVAPIQAGAVLGGLGIGVFLLAGLAIYLYLGKP